MHRRTDFYGPDANEFRPERWEENGKRGWEYLPFNGGPRICLGREFLLTLTRPQFLANICRTIRTHGGQLHDCQVTSAI